MYYRYQWKGGAKKVPVRVGQEQIADSISNEPIERTYKFHLFAIVEEGKEFIEFEARKKGILDRATEANIRGESEGFENQKDSNGVPINTRIDYISLVPNVKVFTAASGFGIRKMWCSFFFHFDRKSPNIITIRPGQDSDAPGDFLFKARGRFLKDEEIKSLVGAASDTYKFYKRQTYLSKAELRNYVQVQAIGAPSSGSSEVRLVRF